MQQFLLLFSARFVTAGIVAVLGSMVASLYYVDLAGIETPEQVMSMRPDAPGSAAALLAEHSDHCWTGSKPKGTVTGVILREHPNDPYEYLPYTHPLYIPALEQVVQDKPRGIDAVLAFCSDRAPTTVNG